MIDKLRKRHLFIRQNAEKFQFIFNYSINHFYDNPILGFNIIKFDKLVIQSPDGVSMKETIFKKYGQEAVDLIYGFIQ